MSAVTDTISRVAQELGVDPRLAIADATVESGLNPTAVGDSGCSYGLFQLNTCGGEGTGMSYGQLVDPETNARRALSEFAAVQQSHPGADPGTIAALAERPADPAGYAARVNSVYSQLGGTSASVGATSGGRPPTPNNPLAGIPIFGGIFGLGEQVGYNGATGQPLNANLGGGPGPGAWAGNAWSWISDQATANLIPLIVAIVVIVLVLGSGSGGQSSAPKIVPVPV